MINLNQAAAIAISKKGKNFAVNIICTCEDCKKKKSGPTAIVLAEFDKEHEAVLCLSYVQNIMHSIPAFFGFYRNNRENMVCKPSMMN